MFHLPLGWYCSYWAAQMVTWTSERKQNQTSRMRGRPRLLCTTWWTSTIILSTYVPAPQWLFRQGGTMPWPRCRTGRHRLSSSWCSRPSPTWCSTSSWPASSRDRTQPPARRGPASVVVNEIVWNTYKCCDTLKLGFDADAISLWQNKFTRQSITQMLQFTKHRNRGKWID